MSYSDDYISVGLAITSVILDVKYFLIDWLINNASEEVIRQVLVYLYLEPGHSSDIV